MKRYLLLIILFLSCFQELHSQKRPVRFEFDPPALKVKTSLYNKIDFVDSRADTSHLGWVPVGGFFKEVVPAVPLQVQFAKMLNSLTENTTAEGHLLLQFRKFSFGKFAGAMTEKGFCYMKATLFAKDVNGSYQKLDSIDSVMVIKSRDIQRAVFKGGSAMVADFIGRNLNKQSTDTMSYTLTDIIHIDEIEKKRIPLYTAKQYKDGVYLTARSFLAQVTDKEGRVIKKDFEIAAVRVNAGNGDSVKLKPGDLYALVFQGVPYIVTNVGFYPLRKAATDFYFTGKIRSTPTAGDYVAAGFMFGAVGGLIGGALGGGLISNEAEMYEVKLDHTNGAFVTLREVFSR